MAITSHYSPCPAGAPALELYEALGDEEGMTIAYNNLGLVYDKLGALDQAGTMYNKAWTLFQKIGAAPQVEHIQKVLRVLHRR